MAQREYFWLSVSQNVVLAIVAVISLLNLYEDGRAWWLAAGLLIALGILLNRWPKRSFHLYLAGEVALVVGLLILEDTAVALCFLFSTHAMLLFPNRTGALWIALLTLMVGAVFVHQQGWVDGLLETLIYAVGYGSFGLAHFARNRAIVTLRESQTLFAELQEAHRQLQAYAERVEELAVAEERNRLAREMHDTLGHRLTVAAVQLEGAQRLIPSDPERAASMVGTVREQVREALSELRRTVTTLRTPLEADLSLPHALTRLVSDFEQVTDLAIHLTLPEEVPALPPAHRLALYRAAQEALTNVQRHAQAQDVWLQLTLQDGEVTLLINDNGVGIPSTAEQTSFGLRGMQERATQLGGELTLESRPGGGAQLSCCLPLPVKETGG